MTTKFWKRICADAEVDLDEYTVMDNYTRRERATFTAKMVESEWDFKKDDVHVRTYVKGKVHAAFRLGAYAATMDECKGDTRDTAYMFRFCTQLLTSTKSGDDFLPLLDHYFKIEFERLPEDDYLDLLRDILKNGTPSADRTGTGTRKLVGRSLRFPLHDAKGSPTIPLFTTRELAPRMIFEELMWMMRGSTDSNELAKKKVPIWDADGSRKSLDAAGLTENVEGDLGPIYGHQWRNFGAPYTRLHLREEEESIYGLELKEPTRSLMDHAYPRCDQITDAIQLLRKSPESRRILVSAWNPRQIKEQRLPPCHLLFQFVTEEIPVTERKEGGPKHRLSTVFYMRSSDTILGLPFNIASYAMLTHIVAAMVNMVPHEVIYFGADVHMYNNHVKSDELKVLLQREPSPAPHFELKKIPKDVDAMGALEWGTDVLVGDYHPQGKLKFELST